MQAKGVEWTKLKIQTVSLVKAECSSLISEEVVPRGRSPWLIWHKMRGVAKTSGSFYLAIGDQS